MHFKLQAILLLHYHCTHKIQETFNNILSGCFTFEEDEFDDISQEAKDFISRLLILEQSNRMHASAALYHPWMLKEKVRFPKFYLYIFSFEITRYKQYNKYVPSTNYNIGQCKCC